jgi:hypothetical protein
MAKQNCQFLIFFKMLFPCKQQNAGVKIISYFAIVDAVRSTFITLCQTLQPRLINLQLSILFRVF